MEQDEADVYEQEGQDQVVASYHGKFQSVDQEVEEEFYDAQDEFEDVEA